MNDLPTTPDESAESLHSLIRPILLLASIFLLNFIARISIAPLLPAIETDLSISHLQAGSLFLMTTAGYFATIMGSGFISSHWCHRNIILFSAFTSGLVLIGLSLCQTFLSLQTASLILGLATGLYLPSGISTITSLVPAKHWGKALAVHELAPNLGFVAAPLISEALLQWSSWRGVLCALGVSSIVCGLAFWRFGQGGKFRGQAPNLSSYKSLLARRSFWIMAILFGLGIGGSFGIYTMLPLYLTAEHHMDRPFANTLIGLSRVPGIVASLMAGWATDRFGPARIMALVFLFAGLMTILLGSGSGATLLFAVIVQPTISVCFFPAGFAALSFLGSAEIRSVAISIAVPLGFIFAGGVLPMGIGLLGDASHFGAGVTGAGVLILFGSLLSRLLKLQDKQKNS